MLSGSSWRTPLDRIYIPTPGRQRSGAITQREITVERTFIFLFASALFVVAHTLFLGIRLQALNWYYRCMKDFVHLHTCSSWETSRRLTGMLGTILLCDPGRGFNIFSGLLSWFRDIRWYFITLKRPDEVSMHYNFGHSILGLKDNRIGAGCWITFINWNDVA